MVRRVRKIIQEAQDHGNRLTDWEEVAEKYQEKYGHTIEHDAGWQPREFVLYSRGQLARTYNRAFAEATRKLKKGQTKSSRLNPVFNVGGGLMDITHAARTAKTPEQHRTLGASLEEIVPRLEQLADIANRKLSMVKTIILIEQEKGRPPVQSSGEA